MKYLFAFFIAIIFSSAVLAQQTKEAKAQYSSVPPYQRDSVMQPFKLLRADSSWLVTTKLSAKQPVLFIFFFPECPHCQHFADSVAKYAGEIKKANIIFTSFQPSFKELSSFADRFHLAGLKNVQFTKDPNYMLGSFFRIENVPFVALYKHGRLIKTWMSYVPMDDLINLVNKK